MIPRSTTFVQRIVVPFAYPVVFTRRLSDPANPALARLLRRAGKGPHRLIVCIDGGLAAAQPRLAGEMACYLDSRPGLAVQPRPPLIVPGGERAKNGWNTAREIARAIGDARLDRHGFVLAMGGGAALDAIGFAAALVHRGIRLIRMPSTVLAQCDAGVGVKNGINARGTKNFIGTFAPPFAVLNDFDLLATLPPRQWTGGLAEAFKVALIKDAALFALLRRRAAALRARDGRAVERIIVRAARIHLDHIREGGDPFETGSSRPLDFGHWSAHKLEMLSRHALGHGEAVAIGIALDVCYAARAGLLAPAECDETLAVMEAVGLPLWAPVAGKEKALLNGLEDFRLHLGGRLTLTLPRGIGSSVEVHDLDRQVLREALAFLRARADRPAGDLTARPGNATRAGARRFGQ